MSHTSTLSQENHWNNRLDDWKLPLYFSKPALHHIKHFVDGMLSTGYTGTLTDIHRESLPSCGSDSSLKQSNGQLFGRIMGRSLFHMFLKMHVRNMRWSTKGFRQRHQIRMHILNRSIAYLKPNACNGMSFIATKRLMKS